MILAAVDVGSNSVRLLVGEVRDGVVVPIEYDRSATRLARGLEESGRLDADAMEVTLRVLRRFIRTARDRGALHLKAVGTSALREAANASKFLDMTKEKTGVSVLIVSGSEEAEMTARGVLSGIPGHDASLILDIGGGSTEVVVCRGGENVYRSSLPAGVVRLVEKHLKSDPPSSSDMKSLDGDISRIVDEESALLTPHLEADSVLIATAGTATTLAAIDLGLEHYDRQRVHSHRIALERLENLSKFLIGLPHDERAEIRGLEPARADLIIAGIRLTIMFMRKLGFRDVIISDAGLLEGVLLSLAGEVSS